MPGFVVDADRSSHPPLEVRGSWAIQVPLVLALERSSCDDPDESLPAIAEAARAAVRVARSRELDLAVAHVRRIVDGNIAGLKPLSPAVQRQVDAFDASIGLLLCEQCKHAPGATKCRHDLVLDQMVVADHSNEVSCLHFVTRTFAALVALADEYQRLVLGDKEPPELRLRLVTSHSTEKPISAKTHFPDSDAADTRAAEIRLVLPVTLGEEDVGKLPYMLFHEIFVHAAEEWDKAGRRKGTPSRCRLREGFVDAAAAHLLAERLRTGTLCLEAYADADDWLANWVGIANQQRAMPALNRGQEKVLALSRQIGRDVFETFKAQQRADVGVNIAAALTRLELNDATRRDWLDALDVAATQIGPDLPNADSPAYALAARLHQLAIQPRVISTEVEKAFHDYFVARDKKPVGDF